MPYCHILTRFFSTIEGIDVTRGTVIPLTIYDELGSRSCRLASADITADGVLAWIGRPQQAAAPIAPAAEDLPGEGEEWADFLAEDLFADPSPSARPSTSAGPSTSSSLSVEDRLARLEVESIQTRRIVLSIRSEMAAGFTSLRDEIRRLGQPAPEQPHDPPASSPRADDPAI